MESKKAQKFLEQIGNQSSIRKIGLDGTKNALIPISNAIKAIEIAEKEMKEKDYAKAIEAHCMMCRATANITLNCNGCTFKKEFLELINK